MAQDVAVPLAIEEPARPTTARWRKMLRLARQHPLGAFGLIIVAVLVFCGVFADVIAPYDPLEPSRRDEAAGTLVAAISEDDQRITVADPDLGLGGSVFIGDEKVTILALVAESGSEATYQVLRGSGQTEISAHPAGATLDRPEAIDDLASPSLEHPFGTDKRGRDVLSRTIWGARISLMIGLVSVAVGISLGTFFGVISGYFGGLVDSVIQRFVDMLLAFPALVLLLAIITVIGPDDSEVRRFLSDYTPVPEGEFWGIPAFLDIFVVSIGIGIAVAVGTARILRGAVLSLKENVYIEAARALGATDRRIMWRHVFPNVAALVVVLATIFLPIAILAEAAISFLGIGVPDPTPSWGADLSEKNREDALEGYWWPAFFPGLALSLVVLGFNMLGDAFRDISDPRLRGTGMGGGGRGGGRGGF